MIKHRYTKEQNEFLKKNVVGRSSQELKEIFNETFQLNLSISQIRVAKKNRGLSSGVDARFKPGNVPFNKGTTGGGYEPTQFKKGYRPHNAKPVGTEVVNGEGYIVVKVEEPSKWISKHRLVWEKANGEIPKGHVLIFGDGNRENCQLDNLLLITRKQLAMLNSHNLIKDHADLTKVGIAIVDIYGKIKEREKG